MRLLFTNFSPFSLSTHAGIVHTAEDKAMWAYEHTKDELLHKTSAETHREMAPHSNYEDELAHGEIPSSTDKVLGSDVTGVAGVGGTATLAPSTPVKGLVGGAGGGADREAEEALPKVSNYHSHLRLITEVYSSMLIING